MNKEINFNHAKRLFFQDEKKVELIDGNLDVITIKSLIDKENPIILEIGANIGQTTFEFIKEMPTATIHCFEPEPRAIREFKKIFNHPQIHLHEIAIGSYNGFVEFHQSSGVEWTTPDGWNQSGSIKPPKTHLELYPWVKFENKITVPISRLDDWAKLHNINHVDFIWADVQGAEADLLAGGQKIFCSTRYIYTEYSNDEQYLGQINLNQIMSLLGQFLIIGKFTGDVLLENPFYNHKLSFKTVSQIFNDACRSGDFYKFCLDHGINSDDFLTWHKSLTLDIE